jgi:hypothetical protein
MIFALVESCLLTDALKKCRPLEVWGVRRRIQSISASSAPARSLKEFGQRERQGRREPFDIEQADIADAIGAAGDHA